MLRCDNLTVYVEQCTDNVSSLLLERYFISAYMPVPLQSIVSSPLGSIEPGTLDIEHKIMFYARHVPHFLCLLVPEDLKEMTKICIVEKSRGFQNTSVIQKLCLLAFLYFKQCIQCRRLSSRTFLLSYHQYTPEKERLIILIGILESVVVFMCHKNQDIFLKCDNLWICLLLKWNKQKEVSFIEMKVLIMHCFWRRPVPL